MTKAEIIRARHRARRRLRADPQLLRPDAEGRRLRRDATRAAAAQGLRRGGHRRPDRGTRLGAGLMLRGQGDRSLTLQGEGRQHGAAGGVLPVQPAATSGPAARRTGRPRSASSATPTSSAPTAPGGGTLRAPPRARRSPSPPTWPSAARARPLRGVHRWRAAAAARRRAHRRVARAAASRSRSRRTARCPSRPASTGSA